MIEPPELFEQIQQRIACKQPTSIVRLGDGEAIILNGWNDRENFKRVMVRQLGYCLPVNQAEEVQGFLTDAYKDADIIGGPTQRHENKGGYWKMASDTARSFNKPLTSIDFHNYFLDKDLFAPLLTNIENLCYVSCRNLDEQFKKRFGVKNVWSYQIAPEMMFTSGYRGANHFPDQFDKIRRWVAKIPAQGSLCLVGAGFVGKIYNSWFKEMGGISLDIGNVFDAWAGKCTRGVNRGLDVEDNTYKL